MATIPLHPASPPDGATAPPGAASSTGAAASTGAAHAAPVVPPLADAQCHALRRLAGLMIPASDTYGVPGADDPVIFADLLASIGAQADAVAQALERLDALAGGPFAALDADAQTAGAERFRTTRGSGAALLVTLVAQCYYRDDRVMRSLGMEPRPPFPKGFDVTPGDWSQLAPVRARGRLWRDAP